MQTQRNPNERFLHNGIVVHPVCVFNGDIERGRVDMMINDYQDPRSVKGIIMGEANVEWSKQENYAWVWEHAVEKPTFYIHEIYHLDRVNVRVAAWFTPEDEVLYYMMFNKAERHVYS